MSEFQYKPVTVVDVLETGACFDGVRNWLLENGSVISADPAKFPGNEWIQKAANNGSGYGDGYGDGYGYGDGDGDGYGDGYGDG